MHESSFAKYNDAAKVIKDADMIPSLLGKDPSPGKRSRNICDIAMLLHRGDSPLMEDY